MRKRKRFLIPPEITQDELYEHKEIASKEIYRKNSLRKIRHLDDKIEIDTPEGFLDLVEFFKRRGY